MLQSGESATVEFKASLCRGVPSGEVEPVVVYSVVKTIAAFLNSKGGTLLIGVEDAGNILGVEYDFPEVLKNNLDGYGLYLSTRLGNTFGPDASLLIDTDFLAIGDKHICAIRVQPGKRPYWVRLKGKNELAKPKDKDVQDVLFIRSGNQTVSLSMTDAIRYALDRWPAR
jgi:predicted HTH transcriptional regulator